MQIVLDAIKQAESKGRRLLVVISGRQGTGKSVLALRILGEFEQWMRERGDGQQEAHGTYLLQGQTRDRFETSRPADLQINVQSWNGHPNAWKNSLVILDEAHLTPPYIRVSPVGSRYRGPSGYGPNMRPSTVREMEIKATDFGPLEDVDWSIDSVPKNDLVLRAAAVAAQTCLIVIRDEHQVREEIAMSNREFAYAVGAIIDADCQWSEAEGQVICQPNTNSKWDGPLFIKLTKQLRNSGPWNEFIHELFKPGDVDLEAIRDRFGANFAHIGERRTFVDDGNDFHVDFFTDTRSFVRWIESQQDTPDHLRDDASVGGFRVFATFSWPDFTPYKITEPGHELTITWAATDERSQRSPHHRKRALAAWLTASEYNYTRHGVGYVKSCQNQDFERVAVFIGRALSWKFNRDDDTRGRWVLDIDAWGFTRRRSGNCDEQMRERLLRQALAETRVLLGRGRLLSGVFFEDPVARKALNEIGFDSTQAAR